MSSKLEQPLKGIYAFNNYCINDKFLLQMLYNRCLLSFINDYWSCFFIFWSRETDNYLIT